MVIRRSHFASICFLALASSIALTEYIAYSPVVSEMADDDLLITEDDSEPQNPEHDDSEAAENIATVLSEDTPDVKENTEPFSDGKSAVCCVASGDTIATILSSFGFSQSEIHSASKALSKVFNIKGLSIGQEITIDGTRDGESLHLKGFSLKVGALNIVKVSRLENGSYTAVKEEIPVKKIIRTVSGEMSPRDSVKSLQQNGIKKVVAIEAVKALNQMINLKSSKGSISFEFLYRDFYDLQGNSIAKPELVYASALVNGKTFRAYRVKDGKRDEYVDSNGVILSTCARTNSMLAQPLNKMRITSAYGYRIHPVRGFSKKHTGVDLGAPVGTPVYAAASGKILRAGYYSGYGKYVKIHHNQSIETAYGHLSKIVVRAGQNIRQGQIIGYVGVTGVTTGPHLHYEVKKNGEFINPVSFVKQEPRKLSGKTLNEFVKLKKEVNLQIVGLVPTIGKNKNSLKIKKIS